MSTQQYPSDHDYQEGEADAAQSGPNSQGRSGSNRKARQRSAFLFPAYGFNTALDIARRVEESGGGSLTEETLAINLGLSAKSSGFRLKSLAARQFKLIGKQGEILATTPVAKAIFKPTSGDDSQRGYREAFMAIPLFKAVAERYRGQRLPDSRTLRNVLEREFQVEHSRVQQAERLLLDSARDTHLLQHTADGTFLAVSDSASGTVDELGIYQPRNSDFTPSLNGNDRLSPFSQSENHPPVNTFTFTTDEIGELPEEEFLIVWRAMGILIRARKRLRGEPIAPNGLPEA